jgi:hypothetical protein
MCEALVSSPSTEKDKNYKKKDWIQQDWIENQHIKINFSYISEAVKIAFIYNIYDSINIKYLRINLMKNE